MRGTLALVACFVSVAVAASQQITAPQPPGSSQGQAAPAPGTATLRGHVFAGDNGQPLRKAQVRIFASEIRENRLTTTSESGAYEFTEVRPGRYTITASKGSYVTVSYGQERPTDAAKPLEIRDKQTVERVDLMLPRGAVLTGRVLDEFGEPASGIQIAAERFQVFQGQRRLVPSGRITMTNDIGEFRLFGVPPGQYYLTATWRNPNNGNPNVPTGAGDRTAYAPLYFPGTTNVAEARRLTVAAAQQIDDVVMVLKPMKASRITGTATGADGKPMTPAMLMVVESRAFFGGIVSGGQVRPDGTFTISGLAPGTYTVRAQRLGPPGDGPEVATATITVSGEDVDNVQLVGAPPSTLSGRVIVDAAAIPSLPHPLMISAQPANFVGVPAPPPPPAVVADDFTFQIKASPGMMRLFVGGNLGQMATTWMVRAVRVNGQDVTDSGIEFKPNEDIAGVEVELTNRTSTVTGMVTNGRGDAVKDYTAIVFTQDKEKWTSTARYPSTARPDQEGHFKITALRPGEYYVIALDRVDPGQIGDPDFLESIRARATAFSLREGETRTVDLKISTGS